MIELAYIQLVGADGQDITIRAIDVVRVEEHLIGSELTLQGGGKLKTTSTVTQVTTALDALWTEYVTRGGSTAAYTPTNVTTDRAFDADSTSTAELADCLGTLIQDLQALGIVG